MSLSSEIRGELSDLLGRLRDGELDNAQLARLDALVGGNPDARRFYLDYVELCASLHWARRDSGEGLASKDEGFGDLEISGVKDAGGRGRGDAGVADVCLPPPPSSFILHPSSSLHPSPLSPLSVGGPVFSYMVATLILGVMLLSAWAYKISRYDRNSVVDNSRGQTAPGVLKTTPELVFVGRVTGMKDCRWSDPRTQTVTGASVPLKRKYALTSGLLEITYTTGARVILEGPCTYEIESDAGGYLALGKLTARVDVAKPQAAKAQDPSPKTQDRNPKSPSSLIPPPSSLFAVRTPTAVVTDLGTEFGVEVGADGNTTSHVFRGSVELRVVEEKRPAAASAGVETDRVVQLIAGESARVTVKKDRSVSLSRQPADPVQFTRHMPASKPILLFEDDFNAAIEDGQAGKCFTQWTHSFGDGRAAAVAGETPGTVLLRCVADPNSAAIVELAGRPEFNFQAFAPKPTRITFKVHSGSGGLRNPDGYPHRKWVGVRGTGHGDPAPAPMALPGFYVTLTLDGRHSAFGVKEQPGNIVFVDLEGNKTFLAGWDWTHYDGDGPQTVIIELTRDSYRVEFGDAGMKNLTGSLAGKLPSDGPVPATAVVYCQGIEASAGLSIDAVRVERLSGNMPQSDPNVRKEEGRR